MKIILWFIIMNFCIISCKKTENEDNNLSELLVLNYLATSNNSKSSCFEIIEGISCPAAEFYRTHNIQYIEVYQKDKFIFESKINNILDGRCDTYEDYSVSLGKDQPVEWFAVYKKDDNYCGIKLGFPDDSSEKYEMSFDGDLNTFKELNVGEYKFIPVRK